MAHWTNVETSMPPPAGQPVPTRPDELNAAWLTACLQHEGALAADARVAAIDVKPIGQGRGFAGQIVRIALRYEPPSATAPSTLIGKFASEHGPTREMMGAVDGYVREVRFYRELAQDIGISTPRCYFAHYDRERGRCCLLLEDLAPSASVEQDQGFTVEQAKLVLEQLAVMHARFWNRQDELPWLTLPDELIDAVQRRFLEGLPRFVERWGKQYPEIAAIGQLMAGFLDGDELHKVVRRAPLTLAHNDLHIENVFMPSAAGGRLALIDWQSLSFARHGTTDVTRVLCVGLLPEVRRAHGSALLRHYHRALVAHGVRGFSRYALGLRFRQEMVAMVLIGVLAFDTLDFGVAGHETAATLATRIDVALRDARVGWILRVMLVPLKLQQALRRLFGGGPRRLSE